jgi:cation transporter-like permease
MKKLIRIPLILIAVGLLLSIAGILLEKYAHHVETTPIPQGPVPSNLPPTPPNPEK